jgi:DNA-directed RNA polymerase subunit RPC12/RpoP
MAKNLKELVKKNKKYIKEDFNINELIDKFLSNEQNRKGDHFIPAFHPSLISKGVECQIWWYYFLKNLDAETKLWSDENLTAMAVGTGIHNEFQHILYRMGILEGVYQCISCGHKFWATSPNDQCPNCRQFFKSWDYLKFKEVPIRVGTIRGHADGLINQQGSRYLLEIKSIKNVDKPNSMYGFERLETRPLDDHFIQTQLYLYGWQELAKQAPLGEEYEIDDNGKTSVKKLDGPVFDGAKIVGVLHFGLIEYIAKNSSEKKSFLIKRNMTPIQFLLDEMQIIWKSFLEEDLDNLKGIEYTNKNKCKKCEYRKACNWNT